MITIMKAIVEQCRISIEQTPFGWRFTGEGALGVIGLAAILFLISIVVPEFGQFLR